MTQKSRYTATGNSLQELPPPEPRELDYYSTSVYTGEPTFDDEGLAKALAAYRSHLSTLRRIPCDKSCIGVLEDGKEYEEGKDYELRKWCQDPEGCCISACDCKEWAFPLSPVKEAEGEDGGEIELLWEDVVDTVYDNVGGNPEGVNHSKSVRQLKSKYIITKR